MAIVFRGINLQFKTERCILYSANIVWEISSRDQLTPPATGHCINKNRLTHLFPAWNIGFVLYIDIYSSGCLQCRLYRLIWKDRLAQLPLCVSIHIFVAISYYLHIYLNLYRSFDNNKFSFDFSLAK